jgi:hypothetical protein
MNAWRGNMILLQSISNPAKAAEMPKRLNEIMMKSFTPNGCTTILEDGQKIPVARLISEHGGNNAGKGGTWSYYGSVIVETADGQNYIIDASRIKQVV